MPGEKRTAEGRKVKEEDQVQQMRVLALVNPFSKLPNLGKSYGSTFNTHSRPQFCCSVIRTGSLSINHILYQCLRTPTD